MRRRGQSVGRRSRTEVNHQFSANAVQGSSVSTVTQRGESPNPNQTFFEARYRRQLQTPVRLNFEIQTKISMFRRFVKTLGPLPQDFSVLDIGFGYGHMLF